MERPLRILHLEDDPDFVSLVSDLLRQEGLPAETTSTQSFQEFLKAVTDNSYDIIFADYSLPTCNGLQALNALREKDPHTPFVMISGTIGEHAAIECLRCGATDYVLKNKLERLVPAIRRAVKEAEERAHRKRIETELVRREKYFRTLTEHSLDVLTILSSEGLFLYNSPSLKKVLAFEPKDVAGQSAFALVHEEDIAGVLGAFKHALENPDDIITHEFRCRRQDGTWTHLEVVGQNRLMDPEIAGVVLNTRDISDRKRAEAELRQGEKQYRMIFEGSPTPMWVMDVETLQILEVNEAAVQHYGYSREEFLAMNGRSLRPSDETERYVKFINEIIKNHPDTAFGRAGLWRHVKKDGEEIDVEIKWSRLAFRGRAGVLVMAHDITERKRAAEALEKSEASLAAAQRIAHLGSWEMDLKSLQDVASNVLRWSDETYRIFGYEPQQVAVTNELYFNAVHPEDRSRVMNAFLEALKKGETYDLEHRIVLPGGQDRHVRQRGEMVTDANGNPVQMVGIVMDITERRQLGEQLRQSQKMEAIGQLAGGVAHDFNNILTVIHGHASLLLVDKTLAQKAAHSAQQIAQAAERATGLTRQLLTFSRRQVMQPRRLDLNQVVSNMTMMLGRILGEDIALQLNYWTEPAFIKADASMMEQVLLNLVVNARDAMPKGGKLAIKIGPAKIDSSHRSYQPEARAGDFFSLAVTDTGCGIDPENLRRIFEPFFTTKEVGKGTGLGLATVYGIVNQHQGWVEVESESGKGSTFRVFLPAADEQTAPTGTKTAPQRVRGGNETILVVEDEIAVRELVCSVLGGHGYEILQAESGVQALNVWQNNKKKIDLLLTDLVMPDHLNGRELAEKLWAEKPKLKVIFTSGYTADVVGKDFVLQRGLHYLQKPYDPQKLAVTVRNCLDGAAN
ncbi:MAG TPA: PAS domain S-box protein [Candidatus Angelobacter sp.]|nr:PAS domain S-box protein [Candidatus Angelobacter sp.]